MHENEEVDSGHERPYTAVMSEYDLTEPHGKIDDETTGMSSEAFLQLDWNHILGNNFSGISEEDRLMLLLKGSYRSYITAKNHFICCYDELQKNRELFKKLMDLLKQKKQEEIVCESFDQQLQGPMSGRYRVFLDDKESNKRKRIDSQEQYGSDEDPREKIRKTRDSLAAQRRINNLTHEGKVIREKTYELAQKNMISALLPFFMNEELSWTQETVKMLATRIERLMNAPLAWNELKKILWNAVNSVTSSCFLKNWLFGSNTRSGLLVSSNVLSRFHFRDPEIAGSSSIRSSCIPPVESETAMEIEEHNENMENAELPIVEKRVEDTNYFPSCYTTREDENVMLLRKKCELKRAKVKLSLLESLEHVRYNNQVKELDRFQEKMGINPDERLKYDKSGKQKEETKESDEYNEAIDMLASLLDA